MSIQQRWLAITFPVIAGMCLASTLFLRWSWIPALIVSASFVAFGCYGYDKMAARSGRARVPEMTLHAVTLVGGAPGALLGQHMFRHKTAKGGFRLVFWGIVVIQVLVLAGALSLRSVA